MADALIRMDGITQDEKTQLEKYKAEADTLDKMADELDDFIIVMFNHFDGVNKNENGKIRSGSSGTSRSNDSGNKTAVSGSNSRMDNSTVQHISERQGTDELYSGTETAGEVNTAGDTAHGSVRMRAIGRLEAENRFLTWARDAEAEKGHPERYTRQDLKWRSATKLKHFTE